MKYSINLVRSTESESGKLELFEHLGFILSNLCYIMLFIVLGYTGQKLYNFQTVLHKEEALLTRLINYSAGKKKSKLVIGYKELKQLQNLEAGRILWSVYLDTIRTHMPPRFKLTGIKFHGDSLTLSGTGGVNRSLDPVEPVQEFTDNLNKNARFNQKFNRLILNSISIDARPEGNEIHFVLTANRK